MNYTRKAAGVLLAFLLVAVMVTAQEPLTVGEPVEATLPAGESLQFAFEATADSTYSVSVESDEFDTFMFIRDADENELVRNDDGGQNTNSLVRVFSPPQDGTYLVEVRGFSPTDTGTFTVTVQAVDLPTLSPGESVTGTFDGEAQSFLYRVEADLGSILDFAVDSNNTLDTVLRVLRPDEVVVAENDDSANSIDPALTEVVVSTEDPYLVLVEPALPNATLSGDFTLSVTESGVLSLDDGPATVELSAENSQRLLTFAGTAEDTVTLTVVVEESENRVTPLFEFSQENTQFANFVMSGLNELTIDLDIPADGEVTLAIRAFSPITLRVTRQEGE